MEEAAVDRPRDEAAAAFAARKLEELLRGTRKLDDLLCQLREEQKESRKAAG